MEGHGCVANDVEPDSLGWSDVPGEQTTTEVQIIPTGELLQAIQEKQELRPVRNLTTRTITIENWTVASPTLTS